MINNKSIALYSSFIGTENIVFILMFRMGIRIFKYFYKVISILILGTIYCI